MVPADNTCRSVEAWLGVSCERCSTRALSPAEPYHSLEKQTRNLTCFHAGIPTLVVAAASMDVVTSISLFGVFLGLAFSEGTPVIELLTCIEGKI